LTELYVLQDAAAADLRSIIRYTRETWGVAQARVYAGKLNEGIRRLAQGEGVYKVLEDIHPDLRVARCEHHYVFCVWRVAAQPIIVAILHEKMDLVTKISERLN